MKLMREAKKQASQAIKSILSLDFCVCKIRLDNLFSLIVKPLA